MSDDKPKIDETIDEESSTIDENDEQKKLDKELDDSMAASDPPASTQPGGNS